MKIKLDERQKNLLYAEVEKEMDAVEMSKEELDSIVGGNLSLKVKTIIPKPPILHDYGTWGRRWFLADR